jgi:cytoskeletal protein RodZ
VAAAGLAALILVLTLIAIGAAVVGAIVVIRVWRRYAERDRLAAAATTVTTTTDSSAKASPTSAPVGTDTEVTPPDTAPADPATPPDGFGAQPSRSPLLGSSPSGSQATTMPSLEGPH